GAVVGRRVPRIDLPWGVDARQLERELDLRDVTLVNDVEAAARGIGALAERDFAVVHRGNAEAKGTRPVVSAGTGRSEAAARGRRRNRRRRGGAVVGRRDPSPGRERGRVVLVRAFVAAGSRALPFPRRRARTRQLGTRLLRPGNPEHLPLPRGHRRGTRPRGD